MGFSSLFKSLGYLISGGGALKILALGTFYYIVKGLGVTGFGEYTLIVAAISLMGVAYRLFSGQIYQVELARSLGEGDSVGALALQKQALLLITGVTALLVILLGTAFIVLAHANIVREELLVYAPYGWIGALYLFTNGYKSVFVSTNYGYGHFKEQAQWDVVEALWRFTLVSLFVTFNSSHLTVPQILFIDWIALLTGWATYRFLFHNNYPSDSSKQISAGSASLLKVIREHGSWFFLRIVVVDLTANMRLWIVGSLISLEAVGIFGAAKRIVQSGKILLPFGVLFNSFLSRNAADEYTLRNSYLQGLRVSVTLSLVVIILQFIFTLSIVPHAFPDMGTELQLVILIMSGIYLFKAGAYSVNSMLGVDRKYKVTFYVVLLSLLGMVVLLPLLTHYFGLYGVAIEAVANSAVAFLIAYYVMLKQRPDFAIRFQDLKGALSFKNIAQLKRLLKE